MRERIRRMPGPAVVALGFGLVGGLWALDLVTGPDISIFYLLPVGLVTWVVGPRGGGVIAVAGAATALVAELTEAGSGGAASFLIRLLSPPSLLPFWNAAARLGVLLVVAYILSALRRALEREKELARTDHLSGVANIRYFVEWGELELERARRYGRPLTALFLDIDEFKSVNDRFGHSSGNAVLRLVGETIKRHVRRNDIVARLGGDEFVVLMPEAGPESAVPAVYKLQTILKEAVRGNGYPVTFSIGVVTFLQPPASIDELMGKADGFMYDAKHGGKDSIKHAVEGEPMPQR